MTGTKRLVLLALLTAAALILSYIESLLPSLGVPGVKLGLANIAVIFVLYRLGWAEAIGVSLARVFLVTLLFGSLGALAYSLAGAVLSLLVMAVLRRTGVFSEVGVSVAGGVSHNAGQVLMAIVLLETRQLIWILPILVVAGLAGGVFTGLVSHMLIRRIPK